MKILFWGTPPYAVPSLDALLRAGHDVVGVVSQPDRRRGRGKQLIPSAVKARAMDLGLPVFTPSRIRRDGECQTALAALGADAYVVVAFGQILPAEVLDQPPLGCWNGHGSLLPRWRGAAPIQWSLISGDPHTGVGIMAMEEGLDTGPVLLEQAIPIGLLENADQLATRMAALTAELLVDAMARIETVGQGEQGERWRRLGLRPQGEVGMTYARMLNKEDFQVDWSLDALSIHRRVMGLFPGAASSWGGKKIKLLATEPLTPVAGERAVPAGTVMQVIDGVGLMVACGGEEPLLLRQAQLEGKEAAQGTRLLQQLGAQPGDRMGG
jgi:methionyl-tRNA formyltransferase